MKHLIIKIVLALIIVFLAYLVVDSIRTPVKFRTKKEKREKVVIKRLKDIRNTQILYKSINNKYAAEWDTLVDFLKTAEIPIVKRESYVFRDINDTVGAYLYNKTVDRKFRNLKSLTRHLERAQYDNIDFYEDKEDKSLTVKVSQVEDYILAADSLFKGDIKMENIKFIPFSDSAVFSLEAGEITKGSVKVKVFEVRAPYQDILYGMDEQLIINLIAEREQLEKYPGLLVGSMEEPSTDGNWEY